MVQPVTHCSRPPVHPAGYRHRILVLHQQQSGRGFRHLSCATSCGAGLSVLQSNNNIAEQRPCTWSRYKRARPSLIPSLALLALTKLARRAPQAERQWLALLTWGLTCLDIEVFGFRDQAQKV